MSSVQIQAINIKLIKLSGNFPSDFAQQPRTLADLDHWKATEFRSFLFYTGPLVLKSVIAKKYYEDFLVLHIAICIFCNSNKIFRDHYHDFAKGLLIFFVQSAKDLYGPTFTVYNIHGLVHLHEDIEFSAKSLNETSAFPFENFMKLIEKMVKNANNPIAQVAKRFQKPGCRDQYIAGPKISVKERDSFFF